MRRLSYLKRSPIGYYHHHYLSRICNAYEEHSFQRSQFYKCTYTCFYSKTYSTFYDLPNPLPWRLHRLWIISNRMVSCWSVLQHKPYHKYLQYVVMYIIIFLKIFCKVVVIVVAVSASVAQSAVLTDIGIRKLVTVDSVENSSTLLAHSIHIVTINCTPPWRQLTRHLAGSHYVCQSVYKTRVGPSVSVLRSNNIHESPIRRQHTALELWLRTVNADAPVGIGDQTLRSE